MGLFCNGPEPTWADLLPTSQNLTLTKVTHSTAHMTELITTFDLEVEEVWLSGNTLVQINEATLHQAELTVRWVTSAGR